MNKEKAALLECAQERLACLREAREKDTGDPRAPLQVEDMWFRREYLADMEETLQKVVDGQDVDYVELYQSISLEMLANSRGWNNLRYQARRLAPDMAN